VEILEEVGLQVGLPKAIWVAQGQIFVSRDLDLWAYQRGATLDSRPGKPTDHAFIKSFQRQIPRARDNELVHNLLDWLPKWTTMQGNVGAR
jgi:transposase InsO family protein